MTGIIFHFQKISPMQKANGLNLKMCSASYNSLMSGMVLGYSCHPKTIRNYEKALADTNKKETRTRIMGATEVSTNILVNQKFWNKRIKTGHHNSTVPRNLMLLKPKCNGNKLL